MGAHGRPDRSMNKITAVDVFRYLVDISQDLSVSTRITRIHKAGPPKGIDGATRGVATATQDVPPPHGGKVHPDEILYVISGRLRITGESEPTTTIEMGPGDACIVGKGYWHRVTVLDFPAQFIHITTGLNRGYRPL